MRVATGVLLLTGALAGQNHHPAVNPDAAIIQDFEKRVDAYVQQRKSIQSKVEQLKATPSQQKIEQGQHDMANALREARQTARQGDIFTPVIAMEIRRLIGLATPPRDGKRVRQSLRSAEPVQLRLNVNDSYPEKVPLQSTPPTLLQNLPKLPPMIEYRLAGSDLVLLDSRANLVIDLIRNVFP